MRFEEIDESTYDYENILGKLFRHYHEVIELANERASLSRLKIQS